MKGVDEVASLAERGQFDDAIERVSELHDPVEQVEALMKIALIMVEKGLDELAWDVIEDAEYIARRSKDGHVRSLCYTKIGDTLSNLGDREGALDYFSMAIDEASRVKNQVERGVILAEIARGIAGAGNTREAMELFKVAFETVARAETDYRMKTDGLIRIAETVEKTGDELPSIQAENFYRMAFDIFEKLRVSQRAGLVEKKLKLVRTVKNAGLPEIRKALLEGNCHYALALVRREFRGAMKIIGQLEVALWMKLVNNPGYVDVVDQVLNELGEVGVSSSNAYSISVLLTGLGYLKEALYLVRSVGDQVMKDDVLRKIALAFSERGEYEAARRVAGAISNPELREQTLREIEATEVG